MQGPEHELTNGSLADVVYTANIPLLGILASADPRGSRNYVQIAIKAATEVLDRNDTRGLFMRRTVEVRNPQGCKRRGECLHHRGEGTSFICQQGAGQGQRQCPLHGPQGRGEKPLGLPFLQGVQL